MEFPDRISVIVEPNARKTALLSTGPVYRIAVKAKPEQGKANAELERFLTRLSGRTAHVSSGRTSKRKTVRFT